MNQDQTRLEWYKEAAKKMMELRKNAEQKPNHKYVKNFQHLISIINIAIDNYGEEITDIETDPDFYYEHVYMQPFCDQYTWLICNDRPELLSRHEFMEEYLIYKNTKKFCGKMCAPVFIEVPEHLKNK